MARELALETPAMLYKHGGDLDWNGKMFDTIIVADEEEAEIAFADGWMLPADALKADPLDHDGDGRRAKKAKPDAA